MKPVVLTILDGWGYSPQRHGNAVLSAKKPNLDKIRNNYPMTLLQASGKAVGMSWGEAGNSEVGHLTLGAGRTVFQYLSRINKAITTGEFFDNQSFNDAVRHVKANNSTLHIAGLLTSGSVHAYLPHLLALIDLAGKNQIQNFKLHLFTDGKDSGLKESPVLIKKVQDHLDVSGTAESPKKNIASVIGRDYSMDRGKNWNYTQKTYELLTEGKGEQTSDLLKKIKELYEQGVTDSDLPPLVVNDGGNIKDNDAVIFFNFREDSMRQLLQAFIEKDFSVFPVKSFGNLMVIAMTQYLENDDLKAAFPIPEIKNGLAETISLAGKTQFHIAETEKYAHVTYFFNCLNNNPYAGETDTFMETGKDILANPEMKAPEIADKIIANVKEDLYDFYVINFANADMLAHMGNLETAVKGVEAIDTQIGRIADVVLEKGGAMIITADHGNAESLLYQLSGDKETKHNENPVPFHLIAGQFNKAAGEKNNESLLQVNGLLSDVAPTVLELMEIQKPAEMTGESLLKIL